MRNLDHQYMPTAASAATDLVRKSRRALNLINPQPTMPMPLLQLVEHGEKPRLQARTVDARTSLTRTLVLLSAEDLLTEIFLAGWGEKAGGGVLISTQAVVCTIIHNNRGGTDRAGADHASIASITYYFKKRERKAKRQSYLLRTQYLTTVLGAPAGLAVPSRRVPRHHLTSHTQFAAMTTIINATPTKTLTHQLNADRQTGLVLAARHAERREPRERRWGRENIVGVDAHALLRVLPQPKQGVSV